MDKILGNNYQRYPLMEVADLYKLLHQAAMGSEHAVHDEQEARTLLERELIAMGDGPDDPLFDPLSPNGQILRVHLRPYARSGKNPGMLLAAFMQTADKLPGSLVKLKEYYVAAVRLAQVGIGPVRREEIESFFSKMEEQHFPAVHHSMVYERLYHPAYRVIARRFLEEN